MLKLLIVIFALACGTSFCTPQDVLKFVNAELKQALKDVHAYCAQETKVEEQQILEALAGNFDDTQNLKCYLKCVTTGLQIMDEHGNVHADSISKQLPEAIKERYQQTVIYCGELLSKMKTEDMCDNALKLNKCAYETNPDIYFLPAPSLFR